MSIPFSQSAQGLLIDSRLDALETVPRIGAPAVLRSIRTRLDYTDVDIRDGYEGVIASADITTALQGTINYIPATGARIRIPGGVYFCGAITIGDGSDGVTSTRNNIRIEGAGGGGYYGGFGTYLAYNGAQNNAAQFLTINGMIYNVQLRGLTLNCNYNAGLGVVANGYRGLVMEDVQIIGFRKRGLKLMGRGGGTGQQNILNSFDRLFIATGGDQAGHPIDSAYGLELDGSYASINDMWLSTFTGCRFDMLDATNSAAGRFAFADSDTFLRCHFVHNGGSGTTGVIFDALANNQYPAGLHFIGCSVKGTSVLEDGSHKILPNYFTGHGTLDLEPIPSHAMLRGTTIEGLDFNLPAASIATVPIAKATLLSTYPASTHSGAMAVLSDGASSKPVAYAVGGTWRYADGTAVV